MAKRAVMGAFYAVFGLVFILMAGIMVKGLIDQNKDEKAQAARYEQMITDGGKTLLTNDILEEDHTKYLEDSAKSKKTFITLLVLFGTVIVAFIITFVATSIIKNLEDLSGKTLAVTITGVIVLAFIAVSVIMTVNNVLVPRLSQDKTKEAYAFATITIKDSEIREEQYETGAGDDRHTETRITYILIDDKGKEISVKKLLFDRYVGPGVYYAGRTAGGTIFSIYPDKYFELKE